MIPNSAVERWIALADAHFGESPATRHSVTNGAVAWALAGKLGMLNEAYGDRAITEAHIKEALKRVFPNVVFVDRPLT